MVSFSTPSSSHPTALIKLHQTYVLCGLAIFLAVFAAENSSKMPDGLTQFLALRVIFPASPCSVLLDDPTSFMDPSSKAAWFERLRDLIRDRTAIVPQRFTNAVRADFIRVMQTGHIVDSGTPSQLIANNSLYAQSWFELVAAGENAGPEYGWSRG